MTTTGIHSWMSIYIVDQHSTDILIDISFDTHSTLNWHLIDTSINHNHQLVDSWQSVNWLICTNWHWSGSTANIVDQWWSTVDQVSMEMSFEGITDQHSAKDAFRTHGPIHLHVCSQPKVPIFFICLFTCPCVILCSFIPSFRAINVSWSTPTSRITCPRSSSLVSYVWVRQVISHHRCLHCWVK